MTEFYNPIVRTFNRLRAGLLASLDVPREVIRPATPLEMLIPVERRREIWDTLGRGGLNVPALGLPNSIENASVVAWLATTASFALWLHEWTALLSGYSFARILYML